MAEAVQLVERFESLIDRYEGFIFDVWGTLYDGAEAYPAAVEVLSQLAARKKRVAILSNSPQRPEVVRARLDKLGIEPHHYQSLVTSGGATYAHLKDRPNSFYQALGQRVFETGPKRFPNLLDDTWFTATTDIEAAEVVLNSGPENPQAKAEDFDGLLNRAHARGLPMICANPDLEVYVGSSVQICAGSIAAAYETLGGEVYYHGKPHAGVFENCLSDLAVAAADCLMVGDNIRTDVTGARALGMPALWLANGIDRGALMTAHGIDLQQATALAAARGLSDILLMAQLR